MVNLICNALKYSNNSFAGNMIRTSFDIICTVLIFLVYCDINRADSVNSTINIINDENATTETHRTMCKITSERLVANAQATFTRVLTGACNAKTINDRFEKLENLINERFDEIKEMIDRITGPSLAIINGDNIESNEIPPARRDEFKRYHNRVRRVSTAKDKLEARYSYYWRVSNLSEKYFDWENGRSERSPIFYVGRHNDGYAMYLRFTPKYFPDGTIFVSVGLTIGLHDSKLAWPFALPIRIELLDVTDVSGNPEDRSSRLWDPATICTSNFWDRPGTTGRSNNPECVGLSIPRQLLVSSASRFLNNLPPWNEKYVWNDSLLVKLSIHL